jgi:hypothetical protein
LLSIFCCCSTSKKTRIILGGAEEIRTELDIGTFIKNTKHSRALFKRQIRSDAEKMLTLSA